VQELGLTTAYKDDDNVKHFCGMLDALAFLPLNDITEGMNHIRQNIPTGNGLEALVDLVEYFDATYVTGSWNCGFASLVWHNHPSLWTLVEALQQDEALATTAIAQEARGQPPVKRVKRSTQQLQSRLLSLCVARRDNKKTATEMLEGLGHIIRF
jgi:phosphoglycolate phosphatase-like HAD superfamily hydrolase